MQLPLIYLQEAGTDPVLSVDGAAQGPGLHLSHWPVNTTPGDLMHELSTGIALNFVRLPRARQAELAEGCTALVNNHFDTDGVLALFVLRHPKVALAHAEPLLEIAAAGDFFHLPSERAFCFDLLITRYGHRQLSPIKDQLTGLADMERYRVVTEHLFARLPDWLEHGIDGERALFQGPLDRLRADLQGLERAEIVPLVHFDLCVLNAAPGQMDEPGRHALFHTAGTDRILWMSRPEDKTGIRARFLIGTRSWFDIPGLTVQPRPDLEALAERLNQLEGTKPGDASAWRFQPVESASPELWFGAAGLPLFCSNPGPALHKSRLTREVIQAEVCDAVRRVWVFKNEDDTTDIEDIFAV
jgi:hypothetical protein